MLTLLVAALVAVPVVEIYVLIQVGQVIGALPTVAALVLVSVLGAMLLRREGTRTWRAFQVAAVQGRVPSREVPDGALLLLAGTLLLTPGFVTDALGLLLLVPPVRAVVRHLVLVRATRRLVRPAAGGGRPSRVVDGRIVVEGQVVEGQVIEDQVVEGGPPDEERPGEH